MPIYTRTGDDGTTALFGGKRVLKSEDLVEVYGSIDELNSWVGAISSDLDAKRLINNKKNEKISNKEIKEFLNEIQSDLFTIGGNLAGWNGELQYLNSRVVEMERTIDILEHELPKLKNFILPGGNKAGSTLHIARSVSRRVERQVVALNSSKKYTINIIIVKYINRLSDLFFVLARYINIKNKVSETIWVGIKRNKSR